ncbi:hypothetical protein Y1Q_0012511 [Alligator mississippiensis]|uniref:Uncharacterized protein n=1 Tax=Alligator mississippiensis TaxID=8496 RepID=A0A151M7Y1_ALLMI|nr:hypothetical protein Y1Q_0012511 [Alligator mississippiensis]
MCFLEEPGRISPSFYNRDMENTALMDIAINIQREQKLFALVPDFQNWNNKAFIKGKNKKCKINFGHAYQKDL